jgi:hypothetical protein
MTPGLRAVLIAAWVLAIGLIAVLFEVDELRGGARVRRLVLQEEDLLEDVRLLELRYNRMLSPDLLDKDLPLELRGEAPQKGQEGPVDLATGGGGRTDADRPGDDPLPFQFSP